MGQLATNIHDAAQAIPTAPVTDPADLLTGPQLLAIFAKVEAAVAVLELLARGARILRTAGVPDNTTDGEDGDLAINLATADLYAKDSGVWAALFNMKGPPGKDATGQAGASAYQLAVQQGFAGTVDQWLASLGRKGDDGKSAYQVAVANGFTGTVGQWLDSLKVQGDAGQRGNFIRWESYGPTNEDGLVGDMWVHSISATKCAFYKCTASTNGLGSWSLRYTSPDATTGGGSGGNYTLPPATASSLGGILVGDNLSITAEGRLSAQTSLVLEQNLSSNSTTAAPAVAAVRAVTGTTQLPSLTTSDKTSLVAAINEVVGKLLPNRDYLNVPPAVRDAVRDVRNTWTDGDLVQYFSSALQDAGAPPTQNGQAASILVGNADVKPGDSFDAYDTNQAAAWRYTYRRRNDGTDGWTRLGKTA